jgi:hypothetical protein
MIPAPVIMASMDTTMAGDLAGDITAAVLMAAADTAVIKTLDKVWAERALQCGFPEQFAQQALGYNSKTVHRAHAKHAEVTVPSLDD